MSNSLVPDCGYDFGFAGSRQQMRPFMGILGEYDVDNLFLWVIGRIPFRLREYREDLFVSIRSLFP